MSKIAITVPISGMRPEERDRREAYIRGLLPAGVDIEILTSPDSPRFLDASEHFGDAVDAAAGFYAGLDATRYGVAIAAGGLDPGIERLRAASPIPVVGPGEASMYVASVYGRPLSVVTVDHLAVAATHQFLEAVKVKPPIASVRSMDTPVRVMLDDLELGRGRLIEACGRAVREDGAQALYLGSMTLGTLGVADELQRTLNVPVFNPWPISVAVAVQCLAAAPPS